MNPGLLSKKAKMLKPSPTLAMAQKARELAASGKDVVSLTVGEPDWDTYEPIKKAGIKAIQEGFTKYTPVNGIPDLRTAISQDTEKHLNLKWALNEVCVGSGAKFVLFAALQMILDEGDEVIIPTPYWVSYPAMVELAGGSSQIVECGEKENFKLTPTLLEKAISQKTKALILCSPSNPTGIIYTTSELKALSEVLVKYPQVLIISDDIYNRLVFTGEKYAPHILQVAPQLKDQTLIVNGASKAFSMTGWRVGWALGPAKLLQVMTDYMSQSTSNSSSISQKATVAGLRECDAEIEKSNKSLEQKKNYFMKELSLIKGFSPIEPQGAFYIWLQVLDFFGRGSLKSSKDVAEVLLEKYLVATVPGVEFGSEGYLHCSFATSQKNLEKTIERFKEFSKEYLT